MHVILWVIKANDVRFETGKYQEIIKFVQHQMREQSESLIFLKLRHISYTKVLHSRLIDRKRLTQSLNPPNDPHEYLIIPIKKTRCFSGKDYTEEGSLFQVSRLWGQRREALAGKPPRGLGRE